MSLPDTFRAYRVQAQGDSARGRIDTISLDQLGTGELVIKTAYSSVNYKDALAGSGQGKILRQYPLVGGIDVAGHVLQSSDPRFKEGDAVLVTGCGLSETRDGGYSEYARVEAKWALTVSRTRPLTVCAKMPRFWLTVRHRSSLNAMANDYR